MSESPEILFVGGYHDGQRWKTSSHLRPLNPIDRWDDNTIERGLASPMVPHETLMLYTVYPTGAEVIESMPRGHSLFRLDCECEPGVHRYVFEKFTPTDEVVL